MMWGPGSSHAYLAMGSRWVAFGCVPRDGKSMGEVEDGVAPCLGTVECSLT